MSYSNVYDKRRAKTPSRKKWRLASRPMQQWYRRELAESGAPVAINQN